MAPIPTIKKYLMRKRINILNKPKLNQAQHKKIFYVSNTYGVKIKI